MKKRTNQTAAPSNGCGCGHHADHSHKHEGRAGDGCCGDAAHHADPARQHEEGRCNESVVPATNQDDHGRPVSDKGKQP